MFLRVEWVLMGALLHSGESEQTVADSELLFSPQEVDVLRVEVKRRISLLSQKQLCDDFERRRAVKK